MKNTSDIHEDDINFAIFCAAQIVANFGDYYLPIFERLSQESKALQDKQRNKNHALAVAQELSKLTQQHVISYKN